MKLEAGRSQDDADVVALLKAGASSANVGRYLGRTWPELLPRFRRLVAQARRERVPSPRGPAGRGRGLGLPTAWQLVRQNGGDLRHEPAPDGPTRFVFTFPRAGEAAFPARGAA